MNKYAETVPPPPPGFAVNPNYSGNPPPPPPYTSEQPASNVVIMVPAGFGSESQRLRCPHCHMDINTSIETAADTKTHLFALLLCVFGLWCCVPCPYCIDSCMATKHYCPNCKQYLGEAK